jgi:hypothetical protein
VIKVEGPGTFFDVTYNSHRVLSIVVAHRLPHRHHMLDLPGALVHRKLAPSVCQGANRNRVPTLDATVPTALNHSRT